MKSSFSKTRTKVASAEREDASQALAAYPAPLQLMGHGSEALEQHHFHDQISSSPDILPMSEYQDVLPVNRAETSIPVSGPGEAPVQRYVMVGNDLWSDVDDLEGDPRNTEAELRSMVEAIESIDYLANPPGSIQAAIADPRMFQLWKGGNYYEANVGGVLENRGQPVNLQHLEVGSVPDRVERGEHPQTMRISGLISCVAIVLEAGDDQGTQMLIGMHYVTGDHTPGEGGINAKGTATLQLMEMLAGAYDIKRVHLCYLPQIGGDMQPYTTANMQAIRTHFGDGICQNHALAQNHVTARLDPDGTVTMDV